MSYPLGVDIGTTYTAAALWRDGRVQTVPLGNRANAVPSVLFLREDGTMLVGEAAARRGIADSDRVAREFKRRMGDEVPILVGGQGFTAHQLTGEVLRWAVARVAELQGGPPQHVVLTHPASWGEFRRNLLVQAALAAGLRDVGMLAEPVAAATWYAAQERVEPGSLIGIYDFGGGTFDASVVRKTDTGMELYGEAGGDDSIGGVDFDHALFRHVCQAAGVDINAAVWDPAGASALGQLFASVVEAKEALSADLDTVVPVVLPGVSQQVLITRAEFEDLIRPQVQGTVGVFGQVVRRAGVDPTKLHAVLLVGGSSRIPLVRELLAQELGIRVAVDAHPKYTVSLGAAVAAAPRVARPRAPMRPMPMRPMPLPPQGTPARTPTPGRPPQGPPVRHSAPVAGQRSMPPAPPIPPPPNQEAQPAVSEQVDLAQTGLTGATDVQAVLAAIQPDIAKLAPPAPRGGDVIHTRDKTGRTGKRGRLIALLIAVVIVGAAAGAIFLLRDSGGEDPGGTTTPRENGSTGGPAEPPAVGAVRLNGGAAIGPDGDDAMRAGARLASGDVVAVGVSADTKPRAWLGRQGGDLEFVQPAPDENGQMSDVVATASGGAVAVGFTGTGAARRPAVWTSADGSAWQLVPPRGDFAPSTGVSELFAVTVAPDATLLAIGKDVRAGGADGDGAVFSSADGGSSWTRLQASGLDGPGPQTVQRLVRTKEGQFVAIGSALQGAKQGPAIWTSADGVKWQASPYLPEGTPTLLGIHQLDDGRLITCGSVGSSDRPAVRCWVQSQQQRWDRWEVEPGNGPAPLYLYGITRTRADTLLLVGIGRGDGGADAAYWNAELIAK